MRYVHVLRWIDGCRRWVWEYLSDRVASGLPHVSKFLVIGTCAGGIGGATAPPLPAHAAPVTPPEIGQTTPGTPGDLPRGWLTPGDVARLTLVPFAPSGDVLHGLSDQRGGVDQITMQTEHEDHGRDHPPVVSSVSEPPSSLLLMGNIALLFFVAWLLGRQIARTDPKL